MVDEGEILYHNYQLRTNPTLEARTTPPMNEDQKRVIRRLFENHNGSIPAYQKRLEDIFRKKGGAMEVFLALKEEERLLRLLQETIDQYKNRII